MKHSILLIISGISLVFGSCKKESTVNPPANNSESQRVKTETGDSGIDTYTYDGSGRLLSDQSTNGTKSVYEYQPGKISRKYFNAANVNTQTYEFEIGTDGLATKQTRPTQLDYQETRIYNSDKQLIKQITLQNNNTYVIDYFYSNGNCDSARASSNGTWTSTARKTYYTGVKNIFDYSNYGTSFYGKGSKDLLKSEQYFYPDGSSNEKTSWVYEFDGMARPIKQTSTHGNNLEIIYFSYY
jgi:YD repeat-containing protein